MPVVGRISTQLLHCRQKDVDWTEVLRSHSFQEVAGMFVITTAETDPGQPSRGADSAQDGKLISPRSTISQRDDSIATATRDAREPLMATQADRRRLRRRPRKAERCSCSLGKIRTLSICQNPPRAPFLSCSDPSASRRAWPRVLESSVYGTIWPGDPGIFLRVALIGAAALGTRPVALVSPSTPRSQP